MPWEQPVTNLPERIEKLRAGALRMIEMGRANEADYGPINIWPDTLLAILKELERG